MTQLILAALFFMALHVGVAGTSIRDRAIEKLGENAYRGAFSLFSLLGIFWLAHAYRGAGYIETWGQLAWFKPIAALLMLVAFLLVALGVATPNPDRRGWRKPAAGGYARTGDTAYHPASFFVGNCGVGVDSFDCQRRYGLASVVRIAGRTGIYRDAFH